MLSPKRVKFRKMQRGRMRGVATRGNTIAFGQFALQAQECGWITSRQIEASRRAMTRYVKRGRKDLDSHLPGQIHHHARRRDPNGFR